MSEAEADDDQRDINYDNGRRAVYLEIMRHCYGEITGGKEINPAEYVLERTAAVQTLRQLCEDFGDNDWPDNLHLADVIEKHLGRHLHDLINQR